MLKATLIVLLVTLCAQVNAEVNPDNKPNTSKPEELKNLSPLLTVKTGNPVYITNQQQNNNFYVFPILESNPTIQTIDIHKYDPNTNILKTIIIIPPKIKKNCRNSSVSQPSVQTEKPTSQPCKNIKTTPTKNTTVSQITKKPCNLSGSTTDTSPTPANERTRIPVIGDPNGSMKCIQDGVYRANNVTCDQYYVCIYGIQYLMDCPYGLVFNEQLKVCDWLENVTDCKPPVFKNFTCPDEGYGTDGNLILKFRYRDSCSQYVACHKRKARLLSCDSGCYFHEESSTCMNYRSSSNCRDVWYSY